MPVLYYVPIIHSIEDFGSLGYKIQDSFASRDAFDRHQDEINKFWALVEKLIDAAIPDPNGLIIYQDSTPVGDREKVFALFEMCFTKSPNYKLVKKLIDHGAILEGTEDMTLVLEQVNIYKSIIEAKSPAEQYNLMLASGQRTLELTRLRDIFIVQRIHQTLTGNSRGILFLGRYHDILPEFEKLPDEYTIICL